MTKAMLKAVTSAAPLTEQALAEACMAAGRTVLEELHVRREDEQIGYRILRDPDALFSGAALVIDDALVAGSWQAVVR